MNAHPCQPSLFVSHGGGPCFWMDPGPLGAAGVNELRDFLAGILARLPARPRAILVVSAHWESPEVALATSDAPPMLFDYYGFPAHTYALSYPAPGAPDLAHRAATLLEAAGLPTRLHPTRGFDHGVFVPMLIIDPAARVPVAVMSIEASLDAERHLAIGRALTPLRDEGVLILGSGSSYHNLRGFFASDHGEAAAFDGWLADRAATPATLAQWQSAPFAQACHPRAEHLMPLMVACGAGAPDAGRMVFRTTLAGKPISCFAYGAFAADTAPSDPCNAADAGLDGFASHPYSTNAAAPDAA